MSVLAKCRSWLNSVETKVYIAHSISAWGDRMWNFAIALFLVKMAGTYSLRLTAVYGLVCCSASIVLGTAVGNWIDRVPRMAAAVKALIVQNSSVVACAFILCFVIQFDLGETPNWIFWTAQVLIIFFGALADLSSMASSISISKDWVVVIAEKDKERLAGINATCRTIDLTTKLLSPLLVGCIMSQMSDLVTAIFIAFWNIVSMIGEYLLLRSIYSSCPELARKNVQLEQADESEVATSDEEQSLEQPEKSPLRPLNVQEKQPVLRVHAPRSWCGSIADNLTNYILSWKAYIVHKISLAGIGLSCLYLTVLAFDGITIGYSFSQGISETVLGVLGGVGALVGIMGTYAYPKLRRRIGLECTGFVGFLLEVSCLVLCVVAVWAPGSPFDPSCIIDLSSPICMTSPLSVTTNVTGLVFGGAGVNETLASGGATDESYRDYTSIVLLMTGITSARFGLWIIDLTVNQIIQEEVKESQRGAINGSQYSLNNLMNLIKFGLVILLPYPKVFGALALISFIVVCLGWLSYAIYCKKKGVSSCCIQQNACCQADIDLTLMSPSTSGKESQAS